MITNLTMMLAQAAVSMLALYAAVSTARNIPEGIEIKGDINDMEHIVVFMQENRAFDHYYGTMKGVRGFNDRAAPELPNGRNIFYQPVTDIAWSHESLCGCALSCHIDVASDAVSTHILAQKSCRELLDETLPPVDVKAGEQCASFMSSLNSTTVQGINMMGFLNGFKCDAGSKVLPDAVPLMQNANTTYLLPFHLQFSTTSATCMDAPTMSYPGDINIHNGGKMDSWNVAREPGFGMSYFKRTDLPYYYSLADSFLVGDQYFQSTFTATNPNRFFLFSGSNGNSVGKEFDILDDTEYAKGITWESMGETLENANISWKVYQGLDNFDDNGFAWFDKYKEAKPDDPLYKKAMVHSLDLVGEFEKDVTQGTLPQVSWIVGPAALSEHATNHPAAGEDLSARLLKVLENNPEMYAKTAFILNYDEGGQFFDHHWTPTAPRNEEDGKSTVSTDGELTQSPFLGVPKDHPIGLGFRVPLFIVSPWTRNQGGIVFSEVSDHTSVIKLIEKRFRVHCPNMSPWRRAITGDLTHAFNFTSPDYTWPTLPDTKNYVNESNHQCKDLPSPEVPEVQSFPQQEQGIKASRALPYEFNITFPATVGNLVTMHMSNQGEGCAYFIVFDRLNPEGTPRKYTVEGGKALTDSWNMTGRHYDLSLHGPNGFVRKFTGSAIADELNPVVFFSGHKDSVEIHAAAQKDCKFAVKDNAYDRKTSIPWIIDFDESVGKADPLQISVASSGNWYDLSVTASCDPTFSRRFMGRVENGKDSVTDPAMGEPAPAPKEPLHPVPQQFRNLQNLPTEKRCVSRRSRLKDECWEWDPMNPFFHSEL